MPRMRRAPRVLLSVLAALPLVIGAPALAQSPSPVPVLDVEWTLTQLDGEAVPADPAITATFDSSGSLSGSGGCNDYSATWSSGDGVVLTVTSLLATFKACSAEVDARESRYFELIEDAESWSFDGTAITVTTADGATLVFGGDMETPSGLQLVGSWPLATVDGEAPPAGLTVTLDIRPDGTLGGEACNLYNASYTATETGDLAVDPIAVTRRSCGDEVDAFETTYLDALQRSTQWGTQGGQLFLFGAADLVFGAGAASDATLTGQEWSLTSLGGAPIPPDSGVTASFGDDGSLTGSGGCNRYMGEYTADGDNLSVGPLAATRMSCGPVVDDLESTFLGALEAASGFAISGTDLVVSTTNDVTLEFSTVSGPVEPTETPRATPAVTPAVTPVPQPTQGATTGDIVGGWRMTSYAGSALPGNMLIIDITFADDGTFAGFGGCNDYSGRWSLDGTSLSLSGLDFASSGTCDQITQGLETGYFSLLPFLDTAEVGEDGSLSLLSGIAGNQGFVFAPAD